MDPMLAELEREFRDKWQCYNPSDYDNYLCQIDSEKRADLLVRLLSAEIEFAFQPPALLEDEFEADGLEDESRVRPNVQLLLLRYPELRKRSDVVIQLAVLEYALRVRFESALPNVESYVQLCENQKEQERLDGLLQLTQRKLADTRTTVSAESKLVTKSDSTIRESDKEASVQLDQMPCNLGCFLLIRRLGRGGMGQVCSAIDLRSTAHVAIKIMRYMDSWSVYRFVEEFAWLSQLNHPHLVKLYDAFAEGDIRYFSMEQVEGSTIREWFRNWNPSDPNRFVVLRQVLAQAASAIRFLHDNQVIHRDIKPSNLMITKNRKAMLLDLGLAIRVARDPRSTDDTRIVGTLQYMAPEVIEGSLPTFSSDWYSFGALIFETVTNSLPTPQKTQTKSEPSTEANNAERLRDVPADIAALCSDLLNHDPNLRPTGNEVIDRLGVSGTPLLNFKSEPYCIGREQPLSQLDDFVNKHSSSKVVLLRGESGIGKTTLLRHWLISIAANNANSLFIAVNCHRQDQSPLRALNMVAQAMVTSLPDLPRSEWEDLTQNEGGEIIYAFPQMQQLVQTAVRAKDPMLGSVEQAARRAAGLHSLLHWLRELSKRRPLFIAIDDAQWADEDSGRLLAQLFKGHLSKDAFQGTLILVDQGRDVQSPLVQQIVQGTSVQSDNLLELILQPLTHDASRMLLSRWIADARLNVADKVTNDLIRRSGGSPFLLREVLCTYANHSLELKLDDQQWLRNEPLERDDKQLSQRFSLFPTAVERVLQYMAIADQPLGYHQLQTVSRVNPNELLQHLNLLASQGWIRFNRNSLDSEVEIAHDRFREIFVKSMPADRMQRRHFRFARMLSSEAPPPWSRIGHHYWQAKCYREAAACYMEAARLAIRNGEFVEGLWFMERAMHPSADRSPAEQREARWLQADSAAACGNSQAAIAYYEQLFKDSTKAEEIALLETLIGEQWIRAGHLEKGLDRISPALRELGINSHTTTRPWLTRWLLRLRSFKLSFAPHSKFTLSDNTQAFTSIEQCVNRIATPLLFLNTSLGADVITALAVISQQRGSQADRSMALLRWANLLSFGSRNEKTNAITWLRTGRRLARKSKSPQAIALCQLTNMLWSLQTGQLRKGIRQGHRAIKAYDDAQLGQQWEAGFVNWALLGIYWYMGQLRTLATQTALLRQAAARRNDTMLTFWMHTHAAHIIDLIDDNPQQGRQSLELAQSCMGDQRFQSPKFFLWLTEVRQQLYEQDACSARVSMDQHWQTLRQSSLMKIKHYAWLAYKIRLCCQLACMKCSPEDKAHWLAESHQCLKQLKQLGVPKLQVVNNAQALVVSAASNQIANQTEWSNGVQRLKESHFDLFAYALQWHQSLYATGQQAKQLRLEAQSFFASQGCVQPEKLMDIILPLPVYSQDHT